MRVIQDFSLFYLLSLLPLKTFLYMVFIDYNMKKYNRAMHTLPFLAFGSSPKAINELLESFRGIHKSGPRLNQEF